MPLNVKRLRADLKRLQVERTTSPVGRETTGATRIVRALLPELRRMRGEGATWPEIAGALAAQGVTQGDKLPLTGRRLSALVHNVEMQARKRAARDGARISRTDIEASATPPGSKRASVGRMALAGDLASPTPNRLASVSSGDTATEEELRRASLAKLQGLLKKE